MARLKSPASKEALMAGKKRVEDVTIATAIGPKRRGRPPKAKTEVKRSALLAPTPEFSGGSGEQKEEVHVQPKKRLGRPPKAAKKLIAQVAIEVDREKVTESEEDVKGSPRTVLRKRVGSRRKGEPRRSAGATLEDPFVKPLQMKKRPREHSHPLLSALQDPKRVPRKPNKFDDYTVPQRAKPTSTASSIDTSETASEVLCRKRKAVDEEMILQRLALRNQKAALEVGGTSSKFGTRA